MVTISVRDPGDLDFTNSSVCDYPKVVYVDNLKGFTLIRVFYVMAFKNFPVKVYKDPNGLECKIFKHGNKFKVMY